jgi:twitching motility protein PilT
MEIVTPDADQEKKLAVTLAGCPLFRALKADHFAQILKAGQVVQYAAGEAIIEQGQTADSFSVILEGEASVNVEGAAGERLELGRVPAPNSVGEVGLLLEEVRSASVVAAGDVLALKFGAKAFQAMFQKIPEFGAGLSHGLAFRLSRVSGKIGLPDYDTSQGKPETEVVTMLPSELCRRHRVLPLQKEGSVLTVGFVDEPSRAVMSAVHSQLPGLEINSAHIDLDFFNEVVRSIGGVKGWTTGSMPVVTEDEEPRPGSPRLDALLERMVAEGASDLHLSARHRPRWRVDGDMHEMADAAPLGTNEVWDLVEPILEGRHKDQFLAENDTDMAYSLPGVARFRVNLFQDYKGAGAVFRQIPSKIMSLEELQMPAVLKKFCEIPKGLVLVTGPTGSGKSTTLAAMVNQIKRHRACHILTLEDPIEFLQESDLALVNQREIGGHTESFARGLRAALREDPDVVLVGELRDRETIQLALETANTGHLVFATLHTNTAVSAVDRVIDQFPAEEQSQVRSVLGDVLRGVVAQTLVRRQSGGRAAVLEIMVVTVAVANLIREHKTVQIPGIMQVNRGLGMCLFNDELQRLIEERQVDMETAMAAAVDKDDLVRRFRSGITLASDPKNREQFRVMAVKPESPGAKAELQRGDLILEVNTRPAKEFTLEDVRSVFRTDGRHAIVVERSGKRVKLTLELVR